ncbi:MAG TPA: uL15m family ribosomal protein [Candidatus Paceibacterota bacterium]|nr:uL15m family ribosomal protein [Candidatus Paceibacterota bacterium]
MKLHTRTSIRPKRLQRIGRSGKRGSYSGRGVKGQHSRSGRRIRPAERDIILKIPKMRGFRNKPKADAPMVFNLGALSGKLKSHAKAGTPLTIDHAFLRSVKLLKKDYKRTVKILGTGEIAFPIAVSGLEVSASAKEKIEKAGGTVGK